MYVINKTPYKEIRVSEWLSRCLFSLPQWISKSFSLVEVLSHVWSTHFFLTNLAKKGIWNWRKSKHTVRSMDFCTGREVENLCGGKEREGSWNWNTSCYCRKATSEQTRNSSQHNYRCGISHYIKITFKYSFSHRWPHTNIPRTLRSGSAVCILAHSTEALTAVSACVHQKEPSPVLQLGQRPPSSQCNPLLQGRAAEFLRAAELWI